jgi:hypothetical protein
LAEHEAGFIFVRDDAQTQRQTADVFLRGLAVSGVSINELQAFPGRPVLLSHCLKQRE